MPISARRSPKRSSPSSSTTSDLDWERWTDSPSSKHQLLHPQVSSTSYAIKSIFFTLHISHQTRNLPRSPKMRSAAVTLPSAAALSLCALARPPPPPPPSAATSTLLAKRYPSGWCSVHFVQYQKKESSANSAGNADYRLDVTLYDALQDDIGGVSLISAPGASFRTSTASFLMCLGLRLGPTTSSLCCLRTTGSRGVVLMRSVIKGIFLVVVAVSTVSSIAR